jgi:pilus assembly protein CpaB
MQLVGQRKAAGTSPLGQLKSSGARKPLLVAVVLGLAAALLSWNYVQRAGQGARQAALVPVIVAATDIPVRTQITPQMLQVKEVAADARHPKAFTAVEQVTGKVTNLPIAAGEQVLSTKFFLRKEDSGLAFRVPPGRRAVSVSVNEVVTAGGLINPGDFVDVIGLFSTNSGSGGSAQTQDTATIVLQNIEVLAVAQSLGGVAEPQGALAGVTGGNKADPQRQEAVARPNARTFTLAVTPEEAQRLILAEEKGKIRLALRAVEDHAPVDVGPTTLSEVRR